MEGAGSYQHRLASVLFVGLLPSSLVEETSGLPKLDSRGVPSLFPDAIFRLEVRFLGSFPRHSLLTGNFLDNFLFFPTLVTFFEPNLGFISHWSLRDSWNFNLWQTLLLKFDYFRVIFRLFQRVHRLV